MSIRELPGKLRAICNDAPFDAPTDEIEQCAAELEALLPVWTRITDDKSTRPSLTEYVILFHAYDDTTPFQTIAKGNQSQEGDWWRPLCDLDFPEEQP